MGSRWNTSTTRYRSIGAFAETIKAIFTEGILIEGNATEQRSMRCRHHQANQGCLRHSALNVR